MKEQVLENQINSLVENRNDVSCPVITSFSSNKLILNYFKCLNNIAENKRKCMSLKKKFH